MRTQGEIEAAISQGSSRFEQDYMGRGPKDIHTILAYNILTAFGWLEDKMIGKDNRTGG